MNKEWLELTKEQRLWIIRNDNLHIADHPKQVQCPWCNETQGYEYEDISYEDDAHDKRICNECGKPFTVRTVVTYDWRTELPEDYLIEQALINVPAEEAHNE